MKKYVVLILVLFIYLIAILIDISEYKTSNKYAYNILGDDTILVENENGFSNDAIKQLNEIEGISSLENLNLVQNDYLTISKENKVFNLRGYSLPLDIINNLDITKGSLNVSEGDIIISKTVAKNLKKEKIIEGEIIGQSIDGHKIVGIFDDYSLTKKFTFHEQPSANNTLGSTYNYTFDTSYITLLQETNLTEEEIYQANLDVIKDYYYNDGYYIDTYNLEDNYYITDDNLVFNCPADAFEDYDNIEYYYYMERCDIDLDKSVEHGYTLPYSYDDEEDYIYPYLLVNFKNNENIVDISYQISRVLSNASIITKDTNPLKVVDKEFIYYPVIGSLITLFFVIATPIYLRNKKEKNV